MNPAAGTLTRYHAIDELSLLCREVVQKSIWTSATATFGVFEAEILENSSPQKLLSHDLRLLRGYLGTFFSSTWSIQMVLINPYGAYNEKGISNPTQKEL